MIAVENFEFVGFPGFYQGPFDMGENLYNEVHNDMYEFDIEVEPEEDKDYNMDYEGYKKAVADNWSANTLMLYNETLGGDCLEIWDDVEVYSPKYYNYDNDRIYARLYLEDNVITDKILPLMEQNRDKLAKMIYDNHTSYDGFCSFMENTYEAWYKYFSDRENIKDNQFSLYLSYVLAYLNVIIGYNGNEERWQDSLVMGVLDEIDIREFMTYTDEFRTAHNM